MYTKRAPGDINIYAMNEDLTTKKLSKKEKAKQYYSFNKEKYANYYQANREKIIVRDRKKYSKNSEYYKQIAKDHYHNNKQHYKLKARTRCSKNSEYYKHKRNTNPSYRLASNLRARMYSAFKVSKVKKSNKTEILLGCTIQEARKHIESQFLEGMSWENYSLFTWHIDHIKPVNTFDLTDTEQQKQCFHYTNLRPLWAKDNLSRPDDGSDIKRGSVTKRNCWLCIGL
jgi:hypothetical protein